MSAIIEKLKGLGAAEEFFQILNVPFDQKILSVCRLHILKRMGQSLASFDSEGRDEAAITEACRAMLQSAYAEFESKSPMETRLFKVLQDRDPARPAEKGKAFVPLSDLTL
jgi:nitrogenase-stabilizing/protective protein